MLEENSRRRRPKRSRKVKNISMKRMKEHLHTEVFNTTGFNGHITQVALNLKVDERIVRDVLEFYFTRIAYVINTTRKIKTKINVYGFFSLWVEKGNRP